MEKIRMKKNKNQRTVEKYISILSGCVQVLYTFNFTLKINMEKYYTLY